MDQQTPNMAALANGQEQPVSSKHFKSFWPIVIIATLSAIIGGLVVWAAYNAGLDEELNSLLPGADRRAARIIEPMVSQADEAMASWRTYRNEEYGFEIKYPKDWSRRITEQNNPNSYYESFVPNSQLNTDYPYPSYLIQFEKNEEVSFEKWFDKRYQGHTNKPTKIEFLLNNSIPAWKISDPETIGGCSGELIMILRKSTIIQLPNADCEKNDIITGINSTFKFTK